MLRACSIATLLLSACAPASTTPVYVATPGAPRATAAPTRVVTVRGRIPRGQRVDHIVAVQIDRSGRRRRIRVRPAADGSYQLQLPPGYQYAMAYEANNQLTGSISFPSAGGRQSQVIDIAYNVVVNQQYVDLGEPTYAGGVYVAAYDPEIYLDSDGDGMVDAQDPDDVDEAPVVAIEPNDFAQGELYDVDDAGGGHDYVDQAEHHDDD